MKKIKINITFPLDKIYGPLYKDSTAIITIEIPIDYKQQPTASNDLKIITMELSPDTINYLTSTYFTDVSELIKNLTKTLTDDDTELLEALDMHVFKEELYHAK